jgi:hypothetical protein
MIHDAPLVSGAHADLTIEFDIPEPVTMPSPVYAAEVVSTGAPPNPEEPVTVDGATLLPNGTLALEFNTISNRVYYVQHSAEMSGWNTILPPIAGTGGRVEWIVPGPHGIGNNPTVEFSRFYSLIMIR